MFFQRCIKSKKRDLFCNFDLLDDVEIIDKNLYVNSISIYGKTKLDYVDCVLVERNQIYNDKIYSFDDKLNIEIAIIRRTNVSI